MAEKPKLRAVDGEVDNTEPKIAAPEDAKDLDELWINSKLGDGITDTMIHKVPIGKPKEFFRVIKDPKYRRRAEIVTLKSEKSRNNTSLSGGQCGGASRRRANARL